PGRPAQRRLYVQGSRAFRETSIARNKAGQDLPNRLTGLIEPDSLDKKLLEEHTQIRQDETSRES
ncbi:unnamed protein product, partial [Ascophyllum nodosum]